MSGRTIIRNFWMLTIATPRSGRLALYTRSHVRTSRAQRPANNVDGGACTLPGSQGAETTLHACPRPQIRPIRGSTFHVTRRRWGPWGRPRLQSGWVLIPPQVPRCVSSFVGPGWASLGGAMPLLIFRKTACPGTDGCIVFPQRTMMMLHVSARGNGRERVCQCAEQCHCVGVGTRDPWRELGVSILDFVQDTPQRVT